jgi:hypothetical protein
MIPFILGFTNTSPAQVPEKLHSAEPCNHCVGYFLPGRHEQSPRTAYRIDSDLPEIFLTTGVLYSTREILPPFETLAGQPVPQTMRRQVNAGFDAIDDSFEVFLYHLSRDYARGETRRIVIVARNIGRAAAELRPCQAMFHGPNAAREDSVESRLAAAVLLEQWERPIEHVLIEPGKDAVVGWTKQIGAAQESDDATSAVFVTGMLRCGVSARRDKPRLEVSVVAIPGGPATADAMLAAARAASQQGAKSGETAMDLLTPPSGCQARRVVGVARNVLWRSNPLEIDVADMPSGGYDFNMALFAARAAGCESARQSVDLLLHPPYVRPDSVGNYMMEYHVRFVLRNSSDVARSVDLRLGKEDAKVGLACQLSSSDTPATLAELARRPVHVVWAGKGSPGAQPPLYARSLLADGPVSVAPGAVRRLDARLMVVGTSSLPYVLQLTPAGQTLAWR